MFSLRCLRKTIKEKRQELSKCSIRLKHAFIHLLNLAQIHDCGFEFLPHPSYFPGLAPSDFHFFPNLKHTLEVENFHQIRWWVTFFEGLKETFLTGIQALEMRWKKCIELSGDYVEK